jgi:WD40 repeat protein
VATDGSVAVTGGDDGTVGVWNLKGDAGGMAAADPKMKALLNSFKPIEPFKERWSVDVYQEGIIIHDFERKLDATIPIGEPGHPVKAGFANTIKSNEKAAERLGQALTDEVNLYNGDLTAQVFEGGVMLWAKSFNKVWYAYHPKRKPADAAKTEPIAPKGDLPAEPFKSLKGHTGPVLAAAISPSGQRAVTLGKDTRVCVWDLPGSKLVGKFEVPGATCVAYTRDENRVIIGTESQSAAVWDVNEQKSVINLPGHTTPVRAACVTPSGDQAWTASEDGKLHHWNTPNFLNGGARTTDKQGISALAISPDGKTLACGSPGGSIRFINPKTGGTVGNHADRLPVTGLAFINGGADVVVARDGPSPFVVHLDRKGANPPPPAVTPTSDGAFKLAADVPLDNQPPQRIGYRADGKYLYLLRPGLMVVADGETGLEVKSWPIDGNFGHIEFGTGNELFIYLHSGKFQVWNFEKGEVVREFDVAQARIPRPANYWLSGDAKKLYVPTNSPNLLIWDVAKWQEDSRLTPYAGLPIALTAPYPGGERFVALVVGGAGPRVIAWDLAQKREVLQFDAPTVSTLQRLFVSPGGKYVVGQIPTAGGQLLVWDGKTGRLLHTVPDVKLAYGGAGFSPGGDYFVYSEVFGRRLVVQLADGKVTDDLKGQRGSNYAAYAPVAGLMACVDGDRRLRIWKFDVDSKPVAMAKLPTPDPKSGTTTVPPVVQDKLTFLKESATLSDTIVGVVIASDNKKVFAATRKGIVHVLDGATAADVGKFEVGKAPIVQLVMSPKYVHPVSGTAIPDRLYTLDEDKRLITLDPDKKPPLIRDVKLDKQLPNVSSATRLVVTPGETYVMVFDPDRKEAYSWNPPKWTTAAIPPALRRNPFDSSTRYVAYTPDGQIGSAHAGSKLVVWKEKAQKDIHMFDRVYSPTWIGLSPEAGVVSIVENGRLHAWKYETGGSLVGDRDGMSFVNFKMYAAATPAGVVTVASDRVIRVWDLRSGKEVSQARLDREPKGVTASVDGKLAAVWYEDGETVGLWSLPELKTPKK